MTEKRPQIDLPSHEGMFPDAFFDGFTEARKELERRQLLSAQGEATISKMEESPYGGFRVWSMPTDVYIDLLSEGFGVGSIAPTRLGKFPT